MIIVAIDETDINKSRRIIESLDNKKCMIKIGSVAFNSLGRDFIHYVANENFDIFLDLKLHDIPNTVSKTIKGLNDLPIQMLTIHTSGGIEMMMSIWKQPKSLK